MYRRPKFLEVLLKIREEMAREADYDVDLFAETVRADLGPAVRSEHTIVDAVPHSDGRAAKRRRAE